MEIVLHMAPCSLAESLMGFQLSRRAHARTLTVAQHTCEDTLSPHHPLCYFLAQARGMRGLHPVGRVPSLRARCAQPVGSASYVQRPLSKPAVYKAVLNSQSRVWKSIQRLLIQTTLCSWRRSHLQVYVLISSTLHFATQGDGGTRMAVGREDSKQTNEQGKTVLCGITGHCSLYRILICFIITSFQWSFQGTSFFND